MERYFLGGNTASGFKGFYDGELERIDKVVLLKGGPGTGKSSLMKAVAKEAAKRGLDHEIWYCSGDPDSVDGVYIKDLNVAVTDATSPHASEARLPVIRECVVDMASALSREKLLPYKKQIEKLFAVKKRSYEHAYEHLNRAFGYSCKKTAEYSKAADVVGIRRKAAAFALENKGVSDAVKQPKGRIRNLFVSAISPLGIKTFDDYLIGKKVVEIKGADVGVHAFMEEVARLLEGDITLMHNPLCPERYDAVVAGDFVITGNAAAFSTAAEAIELSDLEGNAASESEFFRSREKEETAFAIKDLAAARSAHLEAEKYFVGAMDFGVADKLTFNVLRIVFGEGEES